MTNPKKLIRKIVAVLLVFDGGVEEMVVKSWRE